MQSFLFTTFLLNLFIAVVLFWKKIKNLSAIFFALYLFSNAWWALVLIWMLQNIGVETEKHLYGSSFYLATQLIYMAPIALLNGKLWFLKSYLSSEKLLNSVWDYIAILLSIVATLLVWMPDTLFTEIFTHPEGYISLTKGSFVWFFSVL